MPAVNDNSQTYSVTSDTQPGEVNSSREELIARTLFRLLRVFISNVKEFNLEIRMDGSINLYVMPAIKFPLSATNETEKNGS